MNSSDKKIQQDLTIEHTNQKIVSSPENDKIVFHVNLGRTQFKDVRDLQQSINTAKQHRKCRDVIISNEHENVYTLGKSGNRNHLLMNESELKNNKISYYETDRGGDLTYHGPGQLVIYPILDLNNYYKDSHRYLRGLEEVIIMTLNELGIDGYRDEEYTGVWVDNEKICAIGIKIRKWISMHGLAFNINNDLNYFSNIIPCGIFHKGVTSIKKISGKEADFKSIQEIVIKNFGKVFKINIIYTDLPTIQSYYHLTSVDESSQT